MGYGMALTPEPVTALLCSLCGLSWEAHQAKARYRQRIVLLEGYNKDLVDWDAVSSRTEDTQPELIDCVALLQEDRRGPAGPVGPQGATGAKGDQGMPGASYSELLHG